MTSAPTPGGPSWQHEPAAPRPAGPPASSLFFRWLRGLDITRAPDRWVGGVAGGVARRTGLDLALVRGLIVILAVFGGIGVLVYGLAWALLPEPDGRIHVEQAGRGSWTSGLTGAAALVAIGLSGPNLPFLDDGGAGGLLWTLFWIGAVVLFVYWIVNRSSGGRPPPGMPGPQDFGGPGGGPVRPAGPAPFGPTGPPAPPAPSNAGPTDGSSGDVPEDTGGADHPGRGEASGSGPQASDAPSDRGAEGDTDGTVSLPNQDTDRTVPLPYQHDAHTAAYARAYPLPYTSEEASRSGSSIYPQSHSGFGAGAGAFTDTGGPTEPAVTRTRPTRPSGSATALLIGGAIIVAAIILVLDYVNVLDLVDAGVVALAAAAIVLGLGIVALGARGRTSGLVGFMAALATIGALVASFTVVGGAWVVAQKSTATPASLQTASNGYSVLAAQTTIDLTDLPRPTRDVVVPVNALVSEVRVVVPEDVPVEVRARMVLGASDARGTAGTEDTASPEFQGDGGVLQLSNGDLNPDATGATIILVVRGAMSDISIVTAPGTTPRTSGSTPTGDTP